jgi:two-component system sensor histidine kinase RegB
MTVVEDEDVGGMRWVRRRLLSPELRLGQVESGRVRLQTLVLLRWLAIAGQLVAVLLVSAVLKFPLPLGLCLLAILASASLNIFLTWRYRTNVRLPDWQAAVYFAIDLAQLAVLLFLTGGLQNPFALLFMAPVTISATTLSLRSTIALLALSLIYVTSLAFFHMPLPWRPEEAFAVPDLYLVGNWVAISLGLAFMAAYAWRISQESRRMSAALSATQFVLARAQRLSALDGLAAAAAHELGTPLGTIALVARELQRGSLSPEEMKDDLDLLVSQADRCKDILGRLSREPTGEDALYSRLPLHVLLDEIINPHRDLDVHFAVSILPGEEEASEPEIWRRPEILYGLGNFIENAADFAASEVALIVVYTSKKIMLSIIDDGPGFSPDVIEKLGEPYVTTRPRASVQRHDPDGEHEGMGLGFFIAKTLLERTKARVEMVNRQDGKSGAQVTVTWPRDAVEADSAFPQKL